MIDPKVSFLMELASANQQVTEEKRLNAESSIADFEGVAQGNWVKLDDDGAGVVEYRGTFYNTVPIGSKSIPSGTKVNLEFRKGYYTSFW